MYPDDLFKTWKIRFDGMLSDLSYVERRASFSKALSLVQDLTCDVGYSSMILCFDSEINYRIALHELHKAEITEYMSNE
jgi:hypothetical protein